MKCSKLLVIVALVLIVTLLSGCSFFSNIWSRDLLSHTIVFPTADKFSASPVPTTSRIVTFIDIVTIAPTPTATLTPIPTATPVPTIDPMLDEQRRIDLYVAAMKEVNAIEKVGTAFIAVKLSTLDNLSDLGKNAVMAGLSGLQAPVVSYESIKDDSTKFDKYGQPINGVVLSIELKEYTGTTATIDASSFFGVVGADFATYEATYKDGKWTLKWIGGGVS